MAIRLGIGIITYNRRGRRWPRRWPACGPIPLRHINLVVADDGSEDGTVDLLRSQNITVVTGRNMGIAWNKNRALFLLAAIAAVRRGHPAGGRLFPDKDGWDQDWVPATQRWGHVNLAGEWFRDSFLKGSGTVEDPIISKMSPPSAAASRAPRCCTAAIFDSRFRGYGQEHVEHTRRLVRVGYGGSYEEIDGEVRPIYKLLKSRIEVTMPPSFADRPIATATGWCAANCCPRKPTACRGATTPNSCSSAPKWHRHYPTPDGTARSAERSVRRWVSSIGGMASGPSTMYLFRDRSESGLRCSAIAAARV